MAELPALPLGQAEARGRVTRASPRPTLTGAGPGRQDERLGPAIGRISAAFEAARVAMTGEPEAAPEQVLVLEVAGELTDFLKAIRRIDGLEFLVEDAEERIESGADFAAVDNKGKVHPYDRQLYMVFSDHAAWTELLNLWQRFKNGEPMPYGKAPFAHMFSRLENLRPWEDRDRLERTGVLQVWERELAGLKDELVPFEIELWLRSDAERREQAIDEMRADLKRNGGRLISESVRPEIGYHGVLAQIPARLLAETIWRHDVRWLRTGPIRFFHAVGQLAVVAQDGEPEPPVEEIAQRPAPASATPRIAILDGVPLAQHALLAGRIALDDPDGWEGLVQAARRNHGTATASLVIHGDLNDSNGAQAAAVYIRPILWDQAPAWVGGAGREELPRDRLAVDVLHGAIARMYEGESPVAPQVRVIVLALGDAACQFDRFVSPLARLIDWLQSTYEVLILVSAGNHAEEIELPEELDIEDAQELQHEVISALQRRAGLRRLLSPAESINAVTVGGCHEDSASYAENDGRIEPIVTADLVNISSANGGGVRRSVKPDLLLPGGRQLLRAEPHSPGEPRRFSVATSRRAPGVRVAAPARQAGVLDATTYATGTSAAAALAGHHAGHLLVELDELRERYGDEIAGPEFDAVLAKAALVHAASWGSARGIIESACAQPDARKRRETVMRTIGYGRSDPKSALVCEERRATALAASRLQEGEAHVYSFPLPGALAAQTERRRLTLTLAWITPINPQHRAYRRAALYLEPGEMPSNFVAREDVDQYGARRGTVQHDVLSGRKAVPYAPAKTIELVVSCRADAGGLTDAVPYALIVTIEVAEGVSLPIYEQVRQGLRVPVAVRL